MINLKIYPVTKNILLNIEIYNLDTPAHTVGLVVPIPGETNPLIKLKGNRVRPHCLLILTTDPYNSWPLIHSFPKLYLSVSTTHPMRQTKRPCAALPVEQVFAWKDACKPSFSIISSSSSNFIICRSCPLHSLYDKLVSGTSGNVSGTVLFPKQYLSSFLF